MNKLGLYRVLIDLPSSARVYSNDIVNVVAWDDLNRCQFKLVSLSKGKYNYSSITWSGRAQHLEYIGELTPLESLIYGIP